MDLSLFKKSGTTTTKHLISGYASNEEMNSCSPSDTKLSSRTEVIANKVVKFLLTSRESDAFSGDSYGGDVVTLNNVNPTMLYAHKATFQDDIRRCISYVQAGESDMDKDKERLSGIEILEFAYNEDSPTEIHAHIRITTTAGNTALLQLTV